MKDYILVQSGSMQILMDLVNDKLAAGYILVGGVTANQNQLFQALIKNDFTKESL